MRADVTMVRRRAGERYRIHSGGQNLWLSFFPELRTSPLADGFGALVALNEGHLPPEGTMLTYCRRGSEIITYVIDGSLAHKDGSGRPSELLRSGDFQRSNASTSDHASYSNASGREELHVVQLSLRAAPRLAQRPAERRSFPVTGRMGGLRLIGSGDGRLGSLSLAHDVRVYSGVFAADQALDYRLDAGRIVWLQLLRGELALDGMALTAGDGVGARVPGALRLHAGSAVEFVLIDLTASAPHCASQAEGHSSTTFATGAAAHG